MDDNSEIESVSSEYEFENNDHEASEDYMNSSSRSAWNPESSSNNIVVPAVVKASNEKEIKPVSIPLQTKWASSNPSKSNKANVSEIESVVEEDYEEDFYDEDFDAESHSRSDILHKLASPIISNSLPGKARQVSVTAKPNNQSAVFEDDDYSNDFEASSISKISTPAHSPIHRVQTTIPLQAQVQQMLYNTNIANTITANPDMPKVTTIVDEISKELSRLRNQQKMIIQKKRVDLNAKKERAAVRKQHYLDELNDLKSIISDLKRENESNVRKVQEANGEIKYLENRLDEAGERARSFENEKTNLRNIISSLESRLCTMEAENLDLQRKNETLQTDANETKKFYESEVLKYKTMVEVNQKALQTIEIRMNQDRENLPEFHKKILQEKQLQLLEKESNFQNQEIQLKLEYERKLEALEREKKDFLTFLKDTKETNDNDFRNTRLVLETSSMQLKRQQEEFDSFVQEKVALLERQRLELASQDKEIKVFQTSLLCREREFEGRIRGVEEWLQLHESQQLAFRSKLNELNERETNMNVKFDNLVQFERSLLSKQAALDSATAQLKQKTDYASRMMIEIRSARSEKTSIISEIQRERFTLHEQAMRLKDCMSKNLKLSKDYQGRLEYDDEFARDVATNQLITQCDDILKQTESNLITNEVVDSNSREFEALLTNFQLIESASKHHEDAFLIGNHSTGHLDVVSVHANTNRTPLASVPLSLNFDERVDDIVNDVLSKTEKLDHIVQKLQAHDFSL